MGMGEIQQERVEAVAGGDHAHVAGGGLGDHARDLVPGRLERRGDRRPVVVGHDDRRRRLRGGDPGTVRQPQRRHPGPGRGQQGIDVAVVAPGELQHPGPPGDAAGQPDRRHRRLGSGADQPDLLDRGPRDQLLGQRDLALGGRTVGGSRRRRPPDRVQHRRVGMPVQQRSPGADQVDVLAAVGVGQVRTVARAHETRGAPDRVEGPDRGVDPARDHRPRAVEQRRGVRRLPRVTRRARVARDRGVGPVTDVAVPPAHVRLHPRCRGRPVQRPAPSSRAASSAQ